MRLRAGAREVPTLPLRLVEKLPFCENPSECVNPTPAVLSEILEDLRMMKDRHRGRGLTSGLVEIFKTSYELSVGQALAVEHFFER